MLFQNCNKIIFIKPPIRHIRKALAARIAGICKSAFWRVRCSRAGS